MNIIKLKKLTRLQPEGRQRCRTPACCGSGAKLKQLNVSRTSQLLHCLLARVCVCVCVVCVRGAQPLSRSCPAVHESKRLSSPRY